jgi:hypothetical protein
MTQHTHMSCENKEQRKEDKTNKLTSCSSSLCNASIVDASSCATDAAVSLLCSSSLVCPASSRPSIDFVNFAAYGTGVAAPKVVGWRAGMIVSPSSENDSLSFSDDLETDR